MKEWQPNCDARKQHKPRLWCKENHACSHNTEYGGAIRTQKYAVESLFMARVSCWLARARLRP